MLRVLSYFLVSLLRHMGQVADDFFEKLRKNRIQLFIIITLEKKERKDKIKDITRLAEQCQLMRINQTCCSFFWTIITRDRHFSWSFLSFLTLSFSLINTRKCSIVQNYIIFYKKYKITPSYLFCSLVRTFSVDRMMFPSFNSMPWTQRGQKNQIVPHYLLIIKGK